VPAKGVDAEGDRGEIKASLLHVLGEESRNLYITLFLFTKHFLSKERTCAKKGFFFSKGFFFKEKFVLKEKK